MEPMWSPEPITGYRIWSVRHDRFDGMHRIWRSPHHRSVCGNRATLDRPPHVSPGCACGIYAVKDPAWLATQFPGWHRPNVALGEVALTGRVVEHTLGYRAEAATVHRIAVRTRAGMWRSADSDRIEELFAAPRRTLLRAPRHEFTNAASLADALDQQREEG